jgi:hypothetical protein
LIEKDLFSDCNTASAPTSIPIPPPRPSSTHHYSRADELLMSARMISLHRHNIQMRTLTMLDQLTLPLYLHNSTYHPSLTPQAVNEIRPRRTPLRKQPTPLSFRTTTHTPSVQIPPPLASHARSTINVNALLPRHPLPRNPPRSMTRRRASRSQCVRAPSAPSYILATPPLLFYSIPQPTRPSSVPSRTVAKPFSLVRRVYLPTRRTLSIHTYHLLRAVLMARGGLPHPHTRTRARTRPLPAPRRPASVPSTSSFPSSLPASRGPPSSLFPLFLLPPCGVVLFPCCFLRYEYRMKYPP